MPETGTSPCPECAAPTRTSGQSFCDSCGAFLRWDAAGTPRGGRASGTAPRGAAADPAEAETMPLPAVPPTADAPARPKPADRSADREPDATAASDTPAGGAPSRTSSPAPEREPSAGAAADTSGGGAPSGTSSPIPERRPDAGAATGTSGGAPGRTGDPASGRRPEAWTAPGTPGGGMPGRTGSPASESAPGAGAAPVTSGGGMPGRTGSPGSEREPGEGAGSGPAGDGAPGCAGGPAGDRPPKARTGDGEPEGTPGPARGVHGQSDRSPEPARVPEGVPGPRRDADTAADGGGARPEGDGPSGGTAAPGPPPSPAPLRPGARPRPGAAASADAARALLVPVPAAEAVPEPRDAPGTVLPGVPEAARPRVRGPQSADPVPQGPPCPACGTPNPPLRTFCRACASRLEDSRQTGADGPFAGQRPRLDRGRRRWIARVLVVTGLALLLVGGVIGGPPAVRAVQDHFAKRVAVRPTGWSASHSGPGRGPELVFDGYSNTWWGTGYAGDSNGQYLQADFAQPVDLLAVLVTPGTSKRPGQAADQARPQEIDLVVTDSAGRTKTVHKTLDDGGVQRVEVRRRNAVSVRIVLRSAYGAGADRQVAVAEVEFFGRSRT
ncbi:hypothetical protein SUDANB120_00539 [Streptomyces sp. enrichment culture]|uniref:NADase-type glycan-binding domain-containing protein n=1 Tax=Streptomyces sp. enrichment culture TaxID=1795815 RepID=UPI003F5784FF